MLSLLPHVYDLPWPPRNSTSLPLEELMEVVTKLKYMAHVPRTFAIPRVTLIVKIIHEGEGPSWCCSLQYLLWHSMNGVGMQHIWDNLYSMVGHSKIMLGREICYDCWGIGVHVCRRVAHIGGGLIHNFFITQRGMMAKKTWFGLRQPRTKPCNSGLPRTLRILWCCGARLQGLFYNYHNQIDIHN